MSFSLKIVRVPGLYAVARLGVEAPLPAWLQGPGFRAVLYANDETTLVCQQDRVPDEVMAERDWACLRTLGPFPFDAAGIVQALIAPLSGNGIGVFVLCTFDGEHVLIPASEVNAAERLLRAAGHVPEGNWA